MLGINCTLACIKALLLGLEISATSKLEPTSEVRMSEVCVYASVNIQLENEGKTTMTVSGFRKKLMCMECILFQV